MTQKSSKEAFVGYAVESSFAQDSETYSTRLQIMGDSLDVSSLQRPLVERGGVYQYMGDGDFDIPGAYGQINFSFEMDLYGHGSATNGALTETPLASLLGHALGGMSSSAVGGALDGGSHTTSSIASTNTTLQEGSIFRVGTPGDGRAEGYATTVLDSTSAYDLLVALPSAPQDDDDVYAMQVAHLKTESTSVSSDSSSTNNTLRFVLGTANQCYVVRGCALTGITLSGLGVGEIPRVKLDWSGVHYDPISTTFPSTTATGDHAPAPVASGSVFINDVGTSTRNTVEAPNFDVSIEIGMQPIMGPGGLHEGQNIIGWQRVPGKTTVSFSVPAEAAGTQTWFDYFSTDPNSQSYKHLLWQSNRVDGRCIAMYFPRLKPTGNVPSQADLDGLNYVPLTFEALPDVDNASTERGRSPIRIAMG